jgi:hypothetical protein
LLEKKNADMTSKLQAQYRLQKSPSRSQQSSSAPSTPSRTKRGSGGDITSPSPSRLMTTPRHKTTIVSSTPSSAGFAKGNAASAQKKKKLSALVTKLAVSRLAFQEIQSIQQSLNTVVNEKAHLTQELQKLLKRSTTRQSEKVKFSLSLCIYLNIYLNIFLPITQRLSSCKMRSRH